MNVDNTTETISLSSNRVTDTSDSLVYHIATTDDCESLATLINNAYRGPLSHQGWTNETALISMPRTNADEVFRLIHTDRCIFLMFFGKNDQILKGSVYLSYKLESNTGKISMFVVRPDLQARGYGKFILSTAEDYAINNWNVEYMELTAIIQRPELIDYYARRGYVDTGRRQPFFQTPLPLDCLMRDDLEICTMRKCVRKASSKRTDTDK